jgi:Zn-dependent peptidase ImmA (M78 family)/DNA-binding XRE family transcriptional regulator
MQHDLGVDPAVLGASIANARKKAGKTQEALARALGVSRPTFIAIESGQRLPHELQLHAIAKEVGSSVRDLLSLGIPDEALSVRFRSLRGTHDVQAALETLEEYGRRYARLEELANDRITRRQPTVFPLERVANVDRSAEELALLERSRMGLGDGPLPDLRAILEEDSGLRIFGLDELRNSKVSGLFAYSAQYGALVGFNTAHDPRRIRWTLCHEYAHFLTERFEPEITSEVPRRQDRREAFADAFASNFLMPTSGLSRRFTDMAQDAQGNIKVAHLLILAQLFNVSFQALTQRLEDLGRITRGTYAMLMQGGLKPREAEQLLGLEQRTAYDRLPFRYLFLVATLYARGELSEGDAARYLHTNRLAARKLLQEVEIRSNADEEPAANLDTAIGIAR